MFEISVTMNIKDLGKLADQAARQTAREIRTAGREQIGASGRFSSSWVRGLTATVRHQGGGLMIKVLQKPNYAKIFEYGGTSVGRPLLWIPAPGQLDAHGVRASQYPGKLFRPKGRNVLVLRQRGSNRNMVKYIGIPQVTIRPRWNLRAMATQKAQQLVDRLKSMMG